LHGKVLQMPPVAAMPRRRHHTASGASSGIGASGLDHPLIVDLLRAVQLYRRIRQQLFSCQQFSHDSSLAIVSSPGRPTMAYPIENAGCSQNVMESGSTRSEEEPQNNGFRPCYRFCIHLLSAADPKVQQNPLRPNQSGRTDPPIFAQFL
jgi:hypothetical protein